MKIQLLTMKMRNFKGCVKKDLTFNGRDVLISGENRQGKTTILEAYMFCLFNTNIDGSTMNIMPAGEDGILRGVKASVECVLSFDGEEHTIKRTQVEKTNRDKTKVTGYTVSCEIDNVTKTLTDFNSTLSRFFNIKNALLLSSLGRFMQYPIKDRREILTSLSNIPSDEELCTLAKTPSLIQPIRKGIDLKELLQSLKSTETKTKKTIETDESKIEAKIEELDPEVDSLDKDKLMDEKKRYLDGIATCIKKMNASHEDASSEEIRTLENENARVERNAMEKYRKVLDAYQKQKSDLYNKKNAIMSDLSILDKEASSALMEKNGYNGKILKCNEALDVLREEYTALKTSASHITVPTVCFNCKKPLDESVRKASFDKEIGLIAEKMSKINEKARDVKAELSEYASELDSAVGSILFIQKKKKAKNDELNEIVSEIAAIKEPERDKTYLSIIHGNNAQIEALKANKKAPDYSKIIETKEDMQQVYDSVVSDLQRIEKQNIIKKNINDLKESCDYAREKQVEMLGQIDEINQFNDFKIKLVEENVKSFFKSTYFRMFEKNVTNDDFKDTCKAFYEGKDYDSTANAERKYNCDIDIIRGLSKQMNLYVPIFKDDCNNVTTLESIEETQEITLRVEKGQSLTIELL